MRRVLRIALVAAALILVLLGGVTGYCAWRLRQGPIELAWLRPYVEASVGEAQPGMGLTMGGIELGWAPAGRRIELRAIDVHLLHDQSRQELVLPAVAIHPRLLPLLRGRVELHHLTLIAPRLTVVRTEEGVKVRTGAQPGADTDATPALTTTGLLTSLHELLAVVGFIEVRAGEISIDDRQRAHTWRVQELRAKLSMVAARLVARADAQLQSGSLIAALSFEAREAEAGKIEVATGIAQTVPAALLHAIPAASRAKLPSALEEVLAAVTSPITAEGRFALGAPGQLDGPVFIKAHSDSFAVEDTKRGLRLRDGRLELDVEIDTASDTAQIKHVGIAFPDAVLDVDGACSNLSSDSRLQLKGSVKQFPIAALRRYWPTSSAPDARRWVTENITAGVVKDVVATMQWSLGNAGEADRFDLQAVFDDVAVRFAPDMPPVTAVGGSVVVSQAESVFTVARGRLDQLEITGGTVRILPPAEPAPTRVDVDVDVRGPLGRALAVLDHDPVFLGRSLNLSPEDVEGAMDAKVRCAIPLDGAPETVPTISGSARLQNVALRQPINGWPVRAGHFDLRLTATTVETEGRAEVATVPTSIAIHHQLGGSAAVSIHLQALLDTAARAALGLDLGGSISGAIPVTASVTPQKGTWAIDLDADLTAVQFSPPVSMFGKTPGQAGRLTARVLVADGKATHIDRFDVDAGGTVAHGSGEFGSGRLHGLRAQVRVPPTSKSRAGTIVDLSAQAQGEEYAVSLTSKDAGALAELFVSGDARGGSLTFAGSVRPAERDTTVSGWLDIQALHFSHAPVIAQVLALGSLSGLKSTILREGVHFDDMHAELTYQHGIIRMANGRGEGDAMAILAAGSFDTNARQMDVNASVIPSYYGLNTATQKIPILGPLVAKATGEAFQVIDARVHGSFDDPTVTIATASVFAPEIVKEQLRAWRGKPRKQ